MFKRLLLAITAVFPLAIFASSPAPLSPRVGLEESRGFCPGKLYWTSWQEVSPPDQLRVWTSSCGPQPATKRRAVAATGVFRAPDHLELYLLGWVARLGQGIWMENVSNGRKLAVRFAEVPSWGWQRIAFSIPNEWRGQLVRLHVEAEQSGKFPWVGFSEPLDGGPLRDYQGALGLLVRLVEYYLLLSFLFFGSVAIAVRRGVVDLPILVFWGVTGTGVAGYIAFWMWFLLPGLPARCYSIAMIVCALACVFCSVWRMNREQRFRFLDAGKPWSMVFSVALFILAAGFLFGDLDRPITTPAIRYSHQLPIDNLLQYLFSEQIIARHIQHPMIGDWLSSDRPPLQTAFTLFQLPFVLHSRALAYTIVSVLLQSFWAPCLWAFLRLFGIPAKHCALVITATLFTGFIFLNNFFVWPKLMAAAYMLGCSGLLLTPRLRLALQTKPGLSLLAGLLFALGMLSHGGTAFAMLGLIPTLLILRQWPPIRTILLAAVAAAVLYGPWMAYQKFSDPPGDRLLKMHLAGVDQPTTRPFTEVVRTAYANASWSQMIWARRANTAKVVGPLRLYWRNYARFASQLPVDLWRQNKKAFRAARTVRSIQFYNFVPSLGLYMFGPLLLLAGRNPRFRTPAWRAALACLTFTFCTTAVWLVTMFVPKGAIITSGTYVSNLAAIAAGVLAMVAISRRLAVVVVAVQSVITFFIYVVYPQAHQPGVLMEGVLRPGILALLLLALPLMAFTIFYLPGKEEAQSAPELSRA